MAQADAKEDVLSVEDFNPVSELVEYGICSVSSKKYLSGRGGQKNPKLHGGDDEPDRHPKGDNYLTWKFVSVKDGIYALTPLSAKGYYLDGRDGDKNPLMKKGNPKKDESLQWKVIKVKENKVALQGVSSGGYLSGRKPEYSDPTMQKRDLTDDDEFLQWVLMPLNFKLHAYMSEFDFGDAKNVEAILNKSKKIHSTNRQIMDVNMVGLKATFSFSQEMTNTVTTSNTKSFGFGVEYQMNLGVPGAHTSEIRFSASYTYTHNKDETASTSQTYEAGYEFAPPEPGKYEVGMVLYEAKNIKLDYSAKVTYEAKNENDEKKVLNGNDLQALLFYHQSEIAIQSIDNYAIHGTTNGSIKATYGIETQLYNKKLE